MTLEQLRKKLRGQSADDALRLIGEAMAEPGADTEALSALIDQVLGTGLESEDPELLRAAVDAHWRQ